LLEKAITLAENGNGRRLLNILNKEINVLPPSMVDKILKTYCEFGLPKEVELLKKRRGILDDNQYNALAEKVRSNCCYEKYDDFNAALRTLLTSGIKMNPAKMDYNESEVS
jgi:hypothetical protein